MFCSFQGTLNSIHHICHTGSNGYRKIRPCKFHMPQYPCCNSSQYTCLDTSLCIVHRSIQSHTQNIWELLHIQNNGLDILNYTLFHMIHAGNMILHSIRLSNHHYTRQSVCDIYQTDNQQNIPLYIDCHKIRQHILYTILAESCIEGSLQDISSDMYWK